MLVVKSNILFVRTLVRDTSNQGSGIHHDSKVQDDRGGREHKRPTRTTQGKSQGTCQTRAQTFNEKLID